MRSFNSFSGASLQRPVKKVSLSNFQMGSPAVCSLASTVIQPTIQKGLSGASRIRNITDIFEQGAHRHHQKHVRATLPLTLLVS